jgi:small neutral amino acid transporter SnatA (MarC family)
VKTIFKLLCFVCIISLLAPAKMEAQDLNREDKKAARKTKKQQKIDEGRLMIIPLAIPAYTPELAFTLAGGVMMSYKTNKQDSLMQGSSRPIKN